MIIILKYPFDILKARASFSDKLDDDTKKIIIEFQFASFISYKAMIKLVIENGVDGIIFTDVWSLEDVCTISKFTSMLFKLPEPYSHVLWDVYIRIKECSLLTSDVCFALIPNLRGVIIGNTLYKGKRHGSIHGHINYHSNTLNELVYGNIISTYTNQIPTT